jgi:hypothetical protein
MTTLRFDGVDIDGDNATCTIPQFLLILEELTTCEGVNNLIWFGADIEPAFGALEKFRVSSAVRVGSVADLQRLLQELTIPQIIFGVFIGIATEENAPGSWNKFYAEGAAGRRYESSVIELLAFDTSHIEITTDQADILHRLIERFPAAKLVDKQML